MAVVTMGGVSIGKSKALNVLVMKNQCNVRTFFNCHQVFPFLKRFKKYFASSDLLLRNLYPMENGTQLSSMGLYIKVYFKIFFTRESEITNSRATSSIDLIWLMSC